MQQHRNIEVGGATLECTFKGPAIRLCCRRMPAAAPVILTIWRACSLPEGSNHLY